jgi:rhamnose utilization protein RhaD (predicted bifunctional aldolase and dehydrogenase)
MCAGAIHSERRDNMMDIALKGLERISKAVGSHPDIVQGGGGNTSVKIDRELMLIKASGFRLDQVTAEDGFAVVNYRHVIEYFNATEEKDDVTFEKEGAELIKQNTLHLEGYKELRPSVEVGFHSILKKFVIHTHPVYANILCCAVNGNEMMDRVMEPSGIPRIWLPYTMPGFYLTYRIKQKIDEYTKEHGVFPQVIFMQNHGLVVTADDAEECIELHARVNNMIKEYFNISEPYPEIKLEMRGDSEFEGKTEFTRNYIRKKSADLDFKEKVLYPDQIVYLDSDQIAINEISNKINIDTGTGQVIYRTGYNEAKTIEETLTAYLYVIDQVERNGLKLSTMSSRDIDRIKNWDAEKYRKQMVSKQE